MKHVSGCLLAAPAGCGMRQLGRRRRRAGPRCSWIAAFVTGGLVLLTAPGASSWHLVHVSDCTRGKQAGGGARGVLMAHKGHQGHGLPPLDLNLAHEVDGPPRHPLIAVLRGVEAREIEDVAEDLLQSGVSMLSIPVGAPAGFSSISRLRQAFGTDLLLGVATVTSTAQIDEAAAAGASYISCPHTDPEIITRAIDHGLIVMPGVMTLTEAFLALKHGARVLKLFPSSAISPDTLKSMRAVLPKDIPLVVSGGVTPDSMGAYMKVGASGFALGSTMYSAGMHPLLLRQRAQAFVDAWRLHTDNGTPPPVPAAAGDIGHDTVRAGELGSHGSIDSTRRAISR